MKRLLPALLIVGALWLLARPVDAQNGSCPDYTNAIGAPFGFFPPMVVCDNGEFDSELIIAESMPCGVGVRTRRAYVGEQPGFYVVFPPNQSFPSGRAKIEFYGVALDFFGRRLGGNLVIIIDSFDSASIKIDSLTAHSSSADYIVLPSGERLFKFPRGPLTLEVQAAPGGFLHLRQDTVDAFAGAWELYGLRVYDSAGAAPPMCSIPGHMTPTPAPTPTASITPTPSETPDGAPSPTPSLTPSVTRTPSATPTTQSFPTVTPYTTTPTPWPTAMPQPLFTMPAQPTPTPLAVISLPDLESPGLSFPAPGGFDTPEPLSIELSPNATTQARLDGVATTSAQGHAIATRWYTSTNQALGWMSTSVTSTTGISTPLQIAGELTTNLTLPIHYAKAVQIYIPNLWPLILFLLLATIWIFFILIVKFALAITTDLAEVLRKLIELIPGM